MTQLTKTELDDIQIRLARVHELAWLKRFGPPELVALIYEDIPALLSAAGKKTEKSSPKKIRARRMRT